MVFSFTRYQRAVEELRQAGLKEGDFILWCLQNYCPLSMPGVREPSLGQVLASSYEAWRRAQEIRGLDPGEPIPIPPGLDDE
jgi:hypothetical protein